MRTSIYTTLLALSIKGRAWGVSTGFYELVYAMLNEQSPCSSPTADPETAKKMREPWYRVVWSSICLMDGKPMASKRRP